MKNRLFAELHLGQPALAMGLTMSDLVDTAGIDGVVDDIVHPELVDTNKVELDALFGSGSPSLHSARFAAAPQEAPEPRPLSATLIA